MGAIALSIGGALSYGVGAFYAHRYTADVAPVTACWDRPWPATLIPAPVLALVEAPTAHGPFPRRFPARAAVLCTFFAYLLYFRVLQKSGPTETLTVTFLIPIFGVLWGHLLLGESIGLGTLVGLAVVLVGISLVTGYRPRLFFSPRPVTQPPSGALQGAPIVPEAPTDRKT